MAVVVAVAEAVMVVMAVDSQGLLLSPPLTYVFCWRGRKGHGSPRTAPIFVGCAPWGKSSSALRRIARVSSFVGPWSCGSFLRCRQSVYARN